MSRSAPEAAAPPSAPDADASTAALAMIAAGLDKIDQGVTVFDRNLVCVFANARLRDLIDAPAGLLRPGARFEDIIRDNAERGEYGPGDIEAMVAERVARAQEFRAHTLERMRPNGMVLKISGWPLPGGGFATIYTDVTDQRRREALLQAEVAARTLELRQNEARLRLIANEVPAGIAYLDHAETFRFANVRFARAYGLDAAAIVGRRTADVLAPETLATAQPFFDRAQAGEAVDFEHSVVLPEGRRLEIRTFLRPEGEHAGARRGFYVLSINIDRQKQAAAALLQAQKMEALGQLSSGIAHDFNNLLTVILGNLAALAERIGDAPAPAGEEMRQGMLEPALRAARRGADLTRRLLTVARRQPLEPQAVDVVDTARTVAALIAPSLAEGVRLEIVGAERPLFAFVDRAQLETALLNLAINARDAVGAQGRITLTLAPRRLGPAEALSLGLSAGDYVDIRFADDGVGIAPALLDRVFEPFFSTKADRGGSGLGLSIVYGFVRESRGSVAIESRLGEGCEIAILLPGCAPPPDGRAAAPAKAEARLGGRLVLLVDDDAEVRRVLRRDLLALGGAVVEAATGQEALEMAELLDDLALVLSDVAMPGALSGLELAAALAERRPGLPVLLMTGHARERIAAAMGEAAARAALQKPIERAALSRAIAAALEPGASMRAPR